jgi:uncharacterized protein with NRDE domain
MCTLIALHRCLPGAPLVVAANRDEFHARPAEPPAIRAGAGAAGPVLAPLDVQEGGTWLGLNARGLFAAITNRPCPEPDRSRRSRGLLVMDALGEPDADQAARHLEGLPDRSYNPFNLFLSDGRSAWLLTYDDSVRCIELGPGAHVIGNADPEAERTPKLAGLDARVATLLDGAAETRVEGLREICKSHDTDPFRSTCVHAGEYGTRSSLLLHLGEAGSETFLHYAEGPPCQAQYRDFTPLLHELGRGFQGVEGESIARSVR